MSLEMGSSLNQDHFFGKHNIVRHLGKKDPEKDPKLANYPIERPPAKTLFILVLQWVPNNPSLECVLGFRA